MEAWQRDRSARKLSRFAAYVRSLSRWFAHGRGDEAGATMTTSRPSGADRPEPSSPDLMSPCAVVDVDQLCIGAVVRLVQAEGFGDTRDGGVGGLEVEHVGS